MGSYIYKACTTQCFPKTLYFGFSTFNVQCCNDTDRCNTAQYSTFFTRSNQLIMTFASVTFSLFVFYRSTTVSI